MQTHELPDKEFKITIEKMFNQLKENKYRYLNIIKKTMHEQNENINKL